MQDKKEVYSNCLEIINNAKQTQDWIFHENKTSMHYWWFIQKRNCSIILNGA